MENEVWRKIIDWNYYEASNMGRIRSLDRWVRHNYGGMALKKGKILTPSPNLTNHCQVILKEGDRIAYPFVHRLVWEAFNGPIPEGMQINHLDENPLNNRLDNLSLVTPKENTNWGTCIERRSEKHSETMKGTCLYETNPNSKPIVQYDLDGNLIAEYACAKYAIEKYNLNQAALSMNLHSKTKSCGGYVWKFKRDAV